MEIDYFDIFHLENILVEVSSEELYNPYPDIILDGHLRHAAVLIPFIEINQKWNLIFIRRTIRADDRHSGQVALPGGGNEPGETLLETVLREAQEEIGLSPDNVTIIGKLPRFMAISNYLVTPFVGVIKKPFLYRPDPSEVSRVFEIPYQWLADPKNYTVTNREAPGGLLVPVIYYDKYESEVVWGFTARIVQYLTEYFSSRKR